MLLAGSPGERIGKKPEENYKPMKTDMLQYINILFLGLDLLFYLMVLL